MGETSSDENENQNIPMISRSQWLSSLATFNTKSRLGLGKILEDKNTCLSDKWHNEKYDGCSDARPIIRNAANVGIKAMQQDLINRLDHRNSNKPKAPFASVQGS